jgi:hypothetical protein
VVLNSALICTIMIGVVLRQPAPVRQRRPVDPLGVDCLIPWDANAKFSWSPFLWAVFMVTFPFPAPVEEQSAAITFACICATFFLNLEHLWWTDNGLHPTFRHYSVVLWAATLSLCLLLLHPVYSLAIDTSREFNRTSSTRTVI